MPIPAGAFGGGLQGAFGGGSAAGAAGGGLLTQFAPLAGTMGQGLFNRQAARRDRLRALARDARVRVHIDPTALVSGAFRPSPLQFRGLLGGRNG